MGAPSYLLAASLRAVIAQRLVRRICESCGEVHEPDAQERSWVTQMRGAVLAGAGFRKGRGCAHCSNTGYRGRLGVYEYLEPTEAMLTALRKGDSEGFVAAAQGAPHFRPLAQTALDYALAGVTSLEEAMRIAGELEETEPVPSDAPGESTPG